MSTLEEKKSTPCFECEGGVLKSIQKDYVSKHKTLGEITIPSVSMEQCDQCGELLIGHIGSKQIDTFIRKKLNCITPEEVSEFLTKYGLTQKQAFELTGYAEKNFSRWVSGKSRPSESVSKFLRLLLNSEEAYFMLKDGKADADEKIIQFPAEHRQPDAEEKEIIKGIDYKVLAERGVVKATTKFDEKRTELCKSEDCIDLREYRDKMFAQCERIVAFKDNTEASTSLGCGSWIRLGERSALKTKTALYDRDKLISAVDELRELTQFPLEHPETVEKVKEILAGAGVALVFVPSLKNSSLRGCTKRLSDSKAMLLHGLKYKSVAQFWVILFHEIAHLILHIKTSEDIFPEYKDRRSDEKEIEADRWAYDKLVSEDKSLEFTSKHIKPMPWQVKNFAQSIKVHPAVVAEVLYHRNGKKYISHSHLNKEGLFPYISEEVTDNLINSSDFS